MIERNRIWFLDETRGLFILLMVLHHAAYDGVFLLGLPFDFLFTGWFGVIRTFFAGGFVLISGAACRFSHNNFRRSGRCLLLAYGLSLVTALAVPSQQIRFGVLHLLGFAMLLFAVLRPLLDRIPPRWGAVFGFSLFLFSQSVPNGTLGLGPWQIALPAYLYQNAFTAALGFPGRSLGAAGRSLLAVPAAQPVSRGGRTKISMDLSCPSAGFVFTVLFDPPTVLALQILSGRVCWKRPGGKCLRPPDKGLSAKGGLFLDRLCSGKDFQTVFIFG